MGKRKDTDIVEVEVSKCQQCGSIRRSKYFGVRTHEYKGIDDKGTEYTHVVWRRCSCLDCGQHRIDIYRENRV